MQRQTEKHIERYVKVLIAVATVVLIFLCVQLAREYHHLRHLDYISARGSLFSSLHAHAPLGVNDVASVATWMTFEYINHLYALPPDYLETTLHIVDTRYPRITIEEYAEDQRVAKSVLLAQVQNALRAHFAQTP